MSTLRPVAVIILIALLLVVAGCISDRPEKNPATVTTLAPSVTFIRPTTIQPQCHPLNQTNTTCCILINPVGKHTTGEVFEINGTTNLDVDSKIVLEFSEPWMLDLPPGTITKPTPYYQYSGTKGYVKILKGTNGINRWSYQVDLSGYPAPKNYDLEITDELKRCYYSTAIFINSSDSSSFPSGGEMP